MRTTEMKTQTRFEITGSKGQIIAVMKEKEFTNDTTSKPRLDWSKKHNAIYDGWLSIGAVKLNNKGDWAFGYGVIDHDELQENVIEDLEEKIREDVLYKREDYPISNIFKSVEALKEFAESFVEMPELNALKPIEFEDDETSSEATATLSTSTVSEPTLHRVTDDQLKKIKPYPVKRNKDIKISVDEIVYSIKTRWGESDKKRMVVVENPDLVVTGDNILCNSSRYGKTYCLVNEPESEIFFNSLFDCSKESEYRIVGSHGYKRVTLRKEVNESELLELSKRNGCEIYDKQSYNEMRYNQAKYFKTLERERYQ